MCKRVEEGEKICFRTSEVLKMSQREQWLKEAQMIRRKIDRYLDSAVN